MKASNYNNIVEYEGNYILFNALTMKFLYLQKEITQLYTENINNPICIKEIHPDFYEALVKYGFVVSEKQDEIADAKNLIEKVNSDKSSYRLIINPTLNCNFHCWYCYENHDGNTKMNVDIMTRIKHLLSNISKNGLLKNFQLSFFGGEPLLFYSEVLFPIAKYAFNLFNKTDINFYLDITTNGYLLDINRIKELRSLGLCSCQITFDGNKNHHDTTRYVTKEIGSYDTIISNVKNAVKEGVNIVLRINYTEENLNGLSSIFDDLKDLSLSERKRLILSMNKVWQEKNNKLGEKVQNFQKQAQAYKYVSFRKHKRYRLMKQWIFIFVLLACNVFTNTFAQDIRGKILDEQHNPIDYASVLLCHSSDSSFVSGSITDSNGIFYFKDLKVQQQYFLKVSCIGYKSKSISASTQSEMSVILEKDNTSLSEIIIKGHRSYVKQEGNKTIFNLKNMLNVEGLKMNEILKYAPRVTLNSDGEVKIAGKSATIFVNGRRLSSDETSTYLSGLNAAEVSKIEIQQNHGGEKDADIQGGIINIITKHKQLGLNGTLYAKVSSPGAGYYACTPVSNLYFGTEKWNVYGMYSYKQGREKQYSVTTNDYLYNNTKHDETSNYFSHVRNHYYRLGSVLSVSDRQHFELEWNGTLQRPMLDTSDGMVTFCTADGKTYDGKTFTLYKSHSDFMNIAFSYQWDLDDKDGYLRILLNRNYKKDSSNNNLQALYPLYSANDVSEDDITESNASNWSVNADLQKNIGKSWVLKLGTNMSTCTRKSEYASENILTNDASHTDWKYKENIGAGYIGVSKDLSNHCFLKINIRGEYTDITGTYEQQTSRNITKSYMDWFPYLYFSYTTSKNWKYDIQYNRSIYRPPFSLMNAYSNRMSDVLYDKGNPDLRAALTDKIAISANYMGHSVSASYSRTPKDIVEYFQVENGITYHTNVNEGITSTLLLDYSYSGNVCSWWQTNFYISSQYTDLPHSYNRKHLWGGSLSIDNLLDWARIGTFSIDFGATTHTAMGNAYIRGNWALDISYKRYFLHKDLSLQVGIDDVFDTQHQKIVNIVPTLKYSFYTERQYRKIWFSLTYNISSKGKVEKKRLLNSNNIKNRL